MSALINQGRHLISVIKSFYTLGHFLRELHDSLFLKAYFGDGERNILPSQILTDRPKTASWERVRTVTKVNSSGLAHCV